MTSETEKAVQDRSGDIPRLLFVAIAARIAEKAGSWAADTAFYPGEEGPGRVVKGEAVARFCAEIESALSFMKEAANGKR